jgi:NAD(P)-dependent dehydrogenase (short-subunit alcohol dehydrogenase family)
MEVALVTGASRGIGRATALALAEDGFRVALLARSAAGLRETRELVEKRGGTALDLVADVTEAEAVGEAVSAAGERLGPVGVVVNNAGSLRALGSLWEVRPDDWWADVTTSLGGAFNLCRVLVPDMIARGRGRIVNVTSYSALRPAPYQAGYACGKAALAALTEALAASLADQGIAAFSVAPGFTATEMTRQLTESDAGRRWFPDEGQREPLDAASTAELIVRLAGGSADALSGRLLHTLDDVDVLLAKIDEIRRDDLYVPRLRRLPGR